MTECWIDWVEPFGPNNEPVYLRVLASTAIADMKTRWPYTDDQKALDDFIVVRWATTRPL